MNIEPSPRAQIAAGKARRAAGVARDDRLLRDQEARGRIRTRREERCIRRDIGGPRVHALAIDARHHAELRDLDPRGEPLLEPVVLVDGRRRHGGRDRDDVAAAVRQQRAEIDARLAGVVLADGEVLHPHPLARRRAPLVDLELGPREVVSRLDLIELDPDRRHRLRIDDPLRDVKPRVEHVEAGLRPQVGLVDVTRRRHGRAVRPGERLAVHIA